MLRAIPETKRKQSSSSAYKGRKNKTVDRSPYLTRQRTKDLRNNFRRNASESDSDDKGGELGAPSQASKNSTFSKTRTKTTNASTSKTTKEYNGKSAEKQSDRSEKMLQRPYCSQARLSGVARKGKIDEACPNVALHKSVRGRHKINADTLKQLVQKQLAGNPENGCRPLYRPGSGEFMQGARGALFRICLLFHGYVFVAKGTVRAFLLSMSHEANMYEHLESLQGTTIPVCFGFIKLKDYYYLDLHVKIRYMLLMSWGGEIIDEDLEDCPAVWKAIRAVRKAGVDQCDIRDTNLLWNEENKRVMIIDFERAEYIRPSKESSKRGLQPVLQAISPNKKRKNDLDNLDTTNSAKQEAQEQFG
jgi:hypothetical protein